MPALVMAGDPFVGTDNERVVREVATDVCIVSLPYGHHLAEECPADLTEAYPTFFGGHAA